MEKHLPFAIAAATLSLLFFSCGGLDCLFRQKLLLEMPETPETWKAIAIDFYEVEWTDDQGIRKTERIAPGVRAVLSVSRGLPQAILAYPWAGAFRFRPAGFLYPLDCEEEADALPSDSAASAAFNFASGYTAEVAGKLEALGLDAFVYPIEKLKVSWSELNKDPWAFPPWKAAKALAEGAFRVSLFPEAKVLVPLPRGTWLPESSFCALSCLEGGAAAAMLAEGISYFYSDSEVLEVLVEGEESVSLVQSRGLRPRLAYGFSGSGL